MKNAFKAIATCAIIAYPNLSYADEIDTSQVTSLSSLSSKDRINEKDMLSMLLRLGYDTPIAMTTSDTFSPFGIKSSSRFIVVNPEENSWAMIKEGYGDNLTIEFQGSFYEDNTHIHNSILVNDTEAETSQKCYNLSREFLTTHDLVFSGFDEYNNKMIHVLAERRNNLATVENRPSPGQIYYMTADNKCSRAAHLSDIKTPNYAPETTKTPQTPDRFVVH